MSLRSASDMNLEGRVSIFSASANLDAWSLTGTRNKSRAKPGKRSPNHYVSLIQGGPTWSISSPGGKDEIIAQAVRREGI
jgi:hypothetical protein